MTAFLKTSGGTGGTVAISGQGGSIVNTLGDAERGKPGQQLIPHPLNVIETIAATTEQFNNCNPQSQLQKTQQRVQQRVQQGITQQITVNLQESVANSPLLQNNLQQLQNLQQLLLQGEKVEQQIEILNVQVQDQIKALLVSATLLATQQMPTAAKVANSTTAGLKPIVTVAESLANFVPSQGINMQAYSSGVKSVQTVSQACYLG